MLHNVVNTVTATKQFELRIIDLHWIKNDDDPMDLCAHGHVCLRIGNEIVSDQVSGDWNLSSAALSLMRTIENDYKKNANDNQLLPCCGHFMIADDKGETVTILGCGNGVDWIITHDIDTIVHLTENCEKATIDKEEYKNIVFNFADRVEQFYSESQPKIIPTDDFDRRGYLTFWKEWKKLRSER